MSSKSDVASDFLMLPGGKNRDGLWFWFNFRLATRARQAVFQWMEMGVSKNRGTPKSSILIGFGTIINIINHPFSGTLIFGNTQMVMFNYLPSKVSKDLEVVIQLIANHEKQSLVLQITFQEVWKDPKNLPKIHVYSEGSKFEHWEMVVFSGIRLGCYWFGYVLGSINSHYFHIIEMVINPIPYGFIYPLFIKISY